MSHINMLCIYEVSVEIKGKYCTCQQGIHFSVDHSPRPNDDLCILSNDIPLTSTNSSESLSDLDVEDTVIIGKKPDLFSIIFNITCMYFHIQHSSFCAL